MTTKAQSHTERSGAQYTLVKVEDPKGAYMTRTGSRYNLVKRYTKTAAQARNEALLAAHAEVHDLIEQLKVKVDSIDPESADWGHVGDMNYYAERLREMLGQVG